jgi:hypothetical protein
MVDINFTDLNMFGTTGNLNVYNVFVNSWFFGVTDIAFLFILFTSALLLSQSNFNFGQITSIMFALALGFATISGSFLMWGIVILIAVFTGLRLLQSILLRI